jgi:hypothetical protein
MSLNKYTFAIHALIFLCMLLGLLVPFWPLAAVGVALAAFYSGMYLAAGAGLAFDLLYGPPTGFLAEIHFPFFAFALVCCLLRVGALRYILERGDIGRV